MCPSIFSYVKWRILSSTRPSVQSSWMRPANFSACRYFQCSSGIPCAIKFHAYCFGASTYARHISSNIILPMTPFGDLASRIFRLRFDRLYGYCSLAWNSSFRTFRLMARDDEGDKQDYEPEIYYAGDAWSVEVMMLKYRYDIERRIYCEAGLILIGSDTAPSWWRYKSLHR